MFEKIKEKLVMEKGLFIVMIAALLVVFGFIFYIFFGYASKKVAIVYPNEGDELELGKEYEIKWSARGVDKVGIALFDGEKPEWIAQNIPANQGSHKWNINTDHAYGSDFWIAVFDYPWRKGSKIDYSNGPFKITYPDLVNCDRLSLEQEWPYLASNAPGLRKVFITPETFNGNLDGLEGADQKCQASAEKLG
ncbi:MAG: hypothetical protein Q8N69_01620, partial [bacterium]|nr:hypothetical protein [bacterium]